MAVDAFAGSAVRAGAGRYADGCACGAGGRFPERRV